MAFGEGLTHHARHVRLLYLEPFDAGSHRSFTETVTTGINADWTVLTLPGRHWKWRMRSCAAHWALTAQAQLGAHFDAVLASAYVPVAELRGLAPSLAATPVVLYFHENQAAYPDRQAGERDHHFALTQLVSALAADRCLFNSRFNRDSFLSASEVLLGRMPERAPAEWLPRIRARSEVVGFPCRFDATERPETVDHHADGPLLLWNHRWEHDKAPEAFFAALDRLIAHGVPFRVAVCGESFRQAPPCFAAARARLGPRVVAWGHQPRAEYEALLTRCDVVVSTARHEFFGVAVLEAVHAGARALVPDRLSYPELLPDAMRYATDDALVETLAQWCRDYTIEGRALRGDHRALTMPHAAATVLPRLKAALTHPTA